VEYTILVALVDLSASKCPGARKRLPLFLPPEARSPRPVAIGEEASKLQEGSPLGSAARMLCAGFAMAPLPLGGDQRARNTSSVLPLPAGKDEYFWASWTPMPDPYA